MNTAEGAAMREEWLVSQGKYTKSRRSKAQRETEQRSGQRLESPNPVVDRGVEGRRESGNDEEETGCRLSSVDWCREEQGGRGIGVSVGIAICSRCRAQPGSVAAFLSKPTPSSSPDLADVELLSFNPAAVRGRASFTSPLLIDPYKSRYVDLMKFDGYDQLIEELDQLFEFKGELMAPNKNWMIVFTDNEDDMMLVGDDPWQ
ncbi:hypothetical protein ZIOFF_027863 [Zingiber officinale]|uniref:PB1 domain-containing protein n=1 Tax=Zingiber officinale TaxID=94328 RepID=A0A8J5GTX5_ZINOF|nr:hypothetical protein ZIOFF_027863 [Zingiber officinale]